MKTTSQNVVKSILKLTLLVAILLAFSCSTEPIIESESSVDSELLLNRSNSNPRPIINDLYSYPDPAGSGLTLFFGTMSHMGKVHGTVETTLFEDNGDNWHITSSDIIYAANGDELYTSGDITVDLTTLGTGTVADVTGGSIITGGTGRFAGATGYLVYENMIIDITTFNESHTSYGEITY